MQLQTKKKVNLDSASIANLLYTYPSKLLAAFYEMQSSFLIEIYKKYKLENVIEAHKDLESRKIIGPAIIVP